VSARLSEVTPGELRLSGVLDHACGPLLREQGRQLIEASSASCLKVDCSAVERSTSVGLSLLLCLMRDAQAAGKRIEVAGLPAELRQLAGVSGLDTILGLA